MKRFLSVILVLSLLFSLSACGNSSASHNMNFISEKKTNISSFSETDTSEKLTLSDSQVNKIINKIDSIKVDFPNSELFQIDECYKRLNTKINVKSHRFNALNSSGLLEANHLMSIVKKNNENYLSAQKYGMIGVEEPKEDFILDICKLIVDTITSLKNKIPDIDYERVYCNLGNLKILYKKGMVDNAQVTADMVMYISPTMFEIVESMNGDDACRNVVIHEIMHIVQIGCSCEKIKNCTRRCGISYRWSDFELNTTDFGWFFEGSAERNMCNLTGGKPITYRYMIDYIASLNLATMLKNDVTANYAETISFYDDINKLFELFDCKTKADEYEIINMMIAINIVQMKPDEFLKIYSAKNGVDTTDNAVIDDLNNSLKPAIYLVLTKNFYKNLAKVLNKNREITLNDLCFIISLFEASMDNHLRYKKSELENYNKVFINEYRLMREQLFRGIKSSCGVDAETYYKSYSVYTDSKNKKVNASIKWNIDEKNSFYLERTDYLEFTINSKVN